MPYTGDLSAEMSLQLEIKHTDIARDLTTAVLARVTMTIGADPMKSGETLGQFYAAVLAEVRKA